MSYNIILIALEASLLMEPMAMRERGGNLDLSIFPKDTIMEFDLTTSPLQDRHCIPVTMDAPSVLALRNVQVKNFDEKKGM